MSGGADEFTRGRGYLASLSEESNAVTEMLTLAVAIADQSAQFDVSYACRFVVLDSGEWIDTSAPSPEAEQMPPEGKARIANQLGRAMRYLDLRDLIVRHPAYPRLLRFAEAEALH